MRKNENRNKIIITAFAVLSVFLFAVAIYYATGSAQKTMQENARQARIMKRHAHLKLTEKEKSQAIWPNKNGEYAIYVDPNCHKDTKLAVVLAQSDWTKDGYMPIVITKDKSEANIVVEERVSKAKDKEGIMGETYRSDTDWPDKRATIKIDYKYINKVGNFDDMVTTVTHELGHAFGLGHDKDKNSLMSAYDDQGHTQTLPVKDIQKARGIYLALEHYELKERTTK